MMLQMNYSCFTCSMPSESYFLRVMKAEENWALINSLKEDSYLLDYCRAVKFALKRFINLFFKSAFATISFLVTALTSLINFSFPALSVFTSASECLSLSSSFVISDCLLRASRRS